MRYGTTNASDRSRLLWKRPAVSVTHQRLVDPLVYQTSRQSVASKMGADLNYRLARLNDGQVRRLVLAVGLNSSFLHKNQSSKIKKPSKEIIIVRLSGIGF